MKANNDNPPQRLLVVDDDPGLRQLLKKYLDENGYNTSTVEDGASVDEWLSKNTADLIILDLMLPGEDGLSIARRLRVSSQVPVIMLTARGEELDRIIGLEVGADDYLAKPFNPRELLARIRAVLRRSVHAIEEKQQISSLKFGDFNFNPDSKVLSRGGHEVALTNGEASLLEIFLHHPNHMLSRDQIMDYISRRALDPFDRSIDVRVNRLRAKIENDPSSPVFIRTVWGKGYRFTPDGNSE
jgi:DNA-binding response OmpR family regulator